MKKSTIIIIVLLTIVIAFAPLLILKDAKFEGSDGQGSAMVHEVTGGEYEPWVEPVLEAFTGRELSGEMETLFFCIQTGIGVGIIAYIFGYLVARKKYNGDK